jgi:integral membrane sensor domain MASE1
MLGKSLIFLRTAGAVALAYWLVGLLSESLARAGTQSVPVWLAAGVVYGVLLVARAPRRSAVLLGATVASYAWGRVGHGLNAGAGLLFALIEVASIAAGVWVAQRAERAGRASARALGAAGWLIAGAALTAGLGATLIAEFWRWQQPDVRYGEEWCAWAFSTAVGILLVTPVIAVFQGFRIKRSGGMPMAQFAAGAIAFLAFAAIATVVFGQGVEQRFGTVAASLDYLPMPFLLLAAIVWGPRGGALAMFAGALLVIGLTAGGGGPFAVNDSFAGEAVIEVQAYVAVWAALMLVARALSEAQREARAQALDWRLRYERILGAIGAVSVEFDAVTGAAFWGEQAARVLGREVLQFSHVADWHACLEASERVRAQAAWHAIAQGEQSSYQSCYTAKLGARVLTVQVQLAGVEGPDGTVERIAGLLQPVASVRGGGERD